MIQRTLVGVLTALVVPFFVTGLFRLGAPDWTVLVACAVVALMLLVRPGLARAAAVGWVAGCLLWAAFLAYLVTRLGG